MKTAEEFAYFLDAFGDGDWLPKEAMKSLIKEIDQRDKQIQLDSMKEGMRKAAYTTVHGELPNGMEENTREAYYWANGRTSGLRDKYHKILTTAEQLTLEDLA